jgi:hypothetical protein
MPRQVFCSECHEDFRVSSIFVERPNLKHCPYCGASLEPVTGPRVGDTLLEPGHEPSPAGPPPIHRAA